MYDKESIYDNEIEPLMKQIIEICKREQLPMAATFYLQEHRNDGDHDGEPMYCTTELPFPGDTVGHEHIKYVSEAMRYGKQGKPFVASYMITSG
ncbi:hypothetical protein BBD42_13025 [Paenibacillus sp. BIHB 4019]|uniref:Uncharacterized protein n=1 Tax=Paenibacillus sp. BIHB 4019 TaxID=1870819 RepID=A0A1B2DHX0_9BACL|nr:hypothetical protein [Paenibacillus sp. BIHB 4019]ANY67293.1 hypothetical protein BBD42_13025 [Paenibacillus sp. BIHB 4019]